ncbi:hypothetical protein EZ313_17845 [Ramlibacter henchirensis]|uniref:Uncharacterized protein n=1 Tax=Ramlibacter henchirensis TaxID=204072 RepID=A0A4Z0BUT5_9BURK|nr:hypothetical protein [Ramlibacter henchirensis]TFZ03076.1 hypothetical protein EZ313_17845 [Ramlibacter henchirensis]
MKLEYLLFDFTDEETGSCSFDAMASVLPTRLPGVLDEIRAVLSWAYREFGPPSALGQEGEWDFEVQASVEDDVPLKITYDVERARFSMLPAPAGRVTLALTISGSRAFGEAFREAFPE